MPGKNLSSNSFAYNRLSIRFLEISFILDAHSLLYDPDRITNTINVVGSDEPVCRPTVINMYVALSSHLIWFVYDFTQLFHLMFI